MRYTLDELETETLLSIRKHILEGKFNQAELLLQKITHGFTSTSLAVENIRLLGNLLLASGIAEKQIYDLLSMGTRLLIKQWSVDDMLGYLIEFQEQDPELYKYVKDFKETELFNPKDCKKIDIQSIFSKNIAWFKKYNRKFLKDIFNGTDYNRDSFLEKMVTAAYRTSDFLYYCIDETWHSIDFSNHTVKPNPENAAISLLYQLNDLSSVAEFISQHRQTVLIHNVIKFDRYFILDKQCIAICMQILSFPDLDDGNYRVHFLLNTSWKKRLATYIANGYSIPKKIIANQNDFENLSQFGTLLSDHYGIALSRARVEIVKKMYPENYLSSLRKKYKDNISGLRILILTSRHSTYIQYASEELHKGFKSIGCKSLLLRERAYQGAGYTLEYNFRVIQNFKPDLILAINNFRPEYLLKYLPNIPFVTWAQDPPESLSSSCQTVNENDFIFAATKIFAQKSFPEFFPVLKDHPIHLLPYIRNINTINITPENKIKKYDIGYISNLGVSPAIISYYEPDKKQGTARETVIHHFIKQMEHLSPKEIAEIIISKDNCLDMVKQCFKTLNLKSDPPLSNTHELVTKTFQTHVGHFLQKTLPIRYLINNGFDNIFLGGFGWEKMNFFRPFTAGRIAHNDLSRITQNTAINLNLSAAVTFHPKIGEVLEADGFIISPWKGDGDLQPITDFFAEDEEVVLFRTYEEMVDKIKYYLSRPEQREKITQKAKKKFFENFSAENGCQKFFPLSWRNRLKLFIDLVSN